MMKKKMLYWFPRILGIVAILFMMLFSFDCFEEDRGLRDQLLCFLMHNLPSLIVVVILLIAWKWEMIGGILFLAAALTGMFFFHAFSGNWGAFIIMAPFAVTGILFIYYHKLYHEADE